MRPWLILWKAEALLLAVMLVGCASTPPILRPPEIGAGGEVLIHIPRTATVEPVELKPEEVRQAIRRLAREVRMSGSPRETVDKLFQLDALYGDYLYLRQEKKLVPTGGGMPLEGTLTRRSSCWPTGTRDGAAEPSTSREIAWVERWWLASTWTCAAGTCGPWR